MYKYYDILQEIKTKDAKGNINVSFVVIASVRGIIVVKQNQIFQNENGLTTEYSKMFVTTKNYKEYLKNGYKIDNLIIKQVLEHNGKIVCLLNNI